MTTKSPSALAPVAAVIAAALAFTAPAHAAPDMAALEALAERAAQETVAAEWPYMVPGGDVSKVQDHGGKWPAMILARMAQRRPAAFQRLLAATAPGAPAPLDEAAIRKDERARALAEVRAKLAEVK